MMARVDGDEGNFVESNDFPLLTVRERKKMPATLLEFIAILAERPTRFVSVMRNVCRAGMCQSSSTPPRRDVKSEKSRFAARFDRESNSLTLAFLIDRFGKSRRARRAQKGTRACSQKRAARREREKGERERKKEAIARVNSTRRAT